MIDAPSVAGSSPRVRGTLCALDVSAACRRVIPAGAGNARSKAQPSTSHSGHPRGCGERPETMLAAARLTGSSPRVRGTLHHGRVATVDDRVIPAGAGNAQSPTHLAFCTTGHPRGCGERSDRARVGVEELRVIPAGAGNAAAQNSRLRAVSGHPRGCGERFENGFADPTDDGSSPRVRGTRISRTTTRSPRRVIPAGAGNASEGQAMRRNGSGHPRGCGERRSGDHPPRGAGGSSPRVRGTPRPPPACRRLPRVIPAGAGNAGPVVLGSKKTAGHPRGCGERLPRLYPPLAPAGSSPRVRGTRPAQFAPALHRRVIPAGAGNAERHAAPAAAQTGHPRGCGERLQLHPLPHDPAGSSPRVRGTLRHAGRDEADQRVIPAGAGNAGHRMSFDAETGGSSPRVRGTRPGGSGCRTTARVIPAGAGNATPSGIRSSQPPGHPRGCGERRYVEPTFVSDDGSSPRVRGTRSGRDPEPPRGRVIPAGAGNAPECIDCAVPHNGSSPRVRGTHAQFSRGEECARVIPAGAGNARIIRLRVGIAAGHPRGCGERFIANLSPLPGCGSSPRVRGTRVASAGLAAGVRVIPAGAGNAPRSPNIRLRTSGHPRGCGEREPGSAREPEEDGSSPRVRGTLRHGRHGAHHRRVIPAGAGNAS